jgi:hypothetical protein
MRRSAKIFVALGCVSTLGVAAYGCSTRSADDARYPSDTVYSHDAGINDPHPSSHVNAGRIETGTGNIGLPEQTGPGLAPQMRDGGSIHSDAPSGPRP